MKWHVRAFIDNPGGTYDPLPLYEFDDDSGGTIPAVGDIIQEETEGKFRVVERHFDYNGKSCGLRVEKHND